jgi:hypothetical protein
MSELHTAVMRACDSFGTADGLLLLDPRVCAFDHASLQCPSDSDGAANCLAKAKINTIKSIYFGPVDEQGNHYYPGDQLFDPRLAEQGFCFSRWIFHDVHGHC